MQRDNIYWRALTIEVLEILVDLILLHWTLSQQPAVLDHESPIFKKGKPGSVNFAKSVSIIVWQVLHLPLLTIRSITQLVCQRNVCVLLKSINA